VNKKILITGISGFLGSHIAKELNTKGFELIGLKRDYSDLFRCNEFSSDVNWISLTNNWEQQIIDLNPSIIIHSAWEGVGSSDRDNLEIQLKNLNLTVKLLKIAKECKVEKFIAFGSQAEYGNFSGVIDENHKIEPKSAYGTVKHLCCSTINFFCNQNNINWYWLRLFSFFGEKEAENWFIPTVIRSISENKVMNMTEGVQQYAYMYIGDLSNIVVNIINSSASSGIYNLSSKISHSLREIVEKIIEIIKPVKPQVNFGAIPYRENQPMLIQGDVSKLESEIGEFHETSFTLNLKNVVEYYLKNK